MKINDSNRQFIFVYETKDMHIMLSTMHLSETHENKTGFVNKLP